MSEKYNYVKESMIEDFKLGFGEIIDEIIRIYGEPAYPFILDGIRMQCDAIAGTKLYEGNSYVGNCHMPRCSQIYDTVKRQFGFIVKVDEVVIEYIEFNTFNKLFNEFEYIDSSSLLDFLYELGYDDKYAEYRIITLWDRAFSAESLEKALYTTEQ